MLDKAETVTPRRSSVGSGVSGMLAIGCRQGGVDVRLPRVLGK